MMRTLKRGRVLLVVVLVALVGGSTPVAVSRTTAKPEPATAPVAHHAHPAAPGSAIQAADFTGTRPLAKEAVAAADAASQLQALMGQHSILACDMMRARIRNDEDFAQVANAAVGKNTDAMVKGLATIVGDQGAGQFRTLWVNHVTALFNYSRGLATNDAKVRDEAKVALTQFEKDLAALFSAASQGRLPQAAAEANVLKHITHLIGQADAYAARDYVTSNTIYREAYAHTYALGRALAGALLPADQAPALDAPTYRLRSEFGRLLGEHDALAVAASRSGAMMTADFTAIADSLNANTRDLTAAFESLFGAAAANSFMQVWADHVDQIIAYTRAVVAGDQARRNEAVAKLGEFEKRFATFLETATGKRLDYATLAKGAAMHDQMLLRQVDASAAKDYQQAHDIAYEAYHGSFAFAAVLADAFGSTVATRLPAGGPNTGLGGMSRDVGRR
jgi:hypothetical protein